MRPPICHICGERFFEGGGLVTFARTEADEAWYERAKAPGFTGHPPNLEWFCAAHHEAAKALADLPRGEAMVRLREGTAKGGGGA